MSLAVYEVITSRIIQALDQGCVPWRQSWVVSAPKNLISKKAYRGINVFLLNAGRFTSSYFLTYNQAKAKGGNVKKGEKGSPVVFWKRFETDKVGKDGKPTFGAVMRFYTVFNATQCEGIEVPQEGERTSPFTPIQDCQRIVDGYLTGADNRPKLMHGGSRACYAPTADEISMPAKEAFETEEAYYATLYHEMGHSSGHKDRLNREGITDPIKFGSHAYSVEELIAEMTSAFLCGESGILDQTIEPSTSYISNWVSRLQRNPKWVVQAGGQAQRAAELILGRSGQQEAEVEE